MLNLVAILENPINTNSKKCKRSFSLALILVCEKRYFYIFPYYSALKLCPAMVAS